jgi:hypothetical protein
MAAPPFQAAATRIALNPLILYPADDFLVK